MEAQREKLISIQPYFVFDSNDFCQHILTQNGISHFFSFSNKTAKDITVPLLVDGCSNIIFEYRDGCVRTHLIGSTVETRTFSVKADADYFGVRLQPCAHYFIKEFPVKETIGNVVILDGLESVGKFCTLMGRQKDFDSRMGTFLEQYAHFCKEAAPSTGTELFRQIADIIIQRRGMVKISELEKLSGYSSRYINKIFERELGMSAKQLCSSVKFQFLLDDINTGSCGSLTSISSEYHFYDQSHFIHEFKEFTGLTPSEYAQTVLRRNYSHSIRNV